MHSRRVSPIRANQYVENRSSFIEPFMQDSLPIRVLVVDDEPLGREMLREKLQDDAQAAIVGESANGREAADAIQKLSPDLVFLDVQMPELGGFDVLELLAHEQLPRIVFVTAYDQYAVKAFEVHALDYLLKPFDRDRLQTCLSRVRDQIGRAAGADLQARMQKLIAEATGRAYATRLMVKHHGRVVFLQIRDVDWIKALANY